MSQDACLQLGEASLVSFADKLVKRKIKLMFLGVELECEVENWRQELYLRLAAAGKESSLRRGVLQALPHEKAFVPHMFDKPSAANTHTLASMKVWQAGRAMALQALVGEERNIKFISKTLEGQKDEIATVDRSFNLEMSFLEHLVSGGAMQILEQKVLDILPSETKKVTYPDAIGKLIELKRQAVYDLSPPSVQAIVGACLEMVTALQRGMQPSNVVNTTGFALKIADRFYAQRLDWGGMGCPYHLVDRRCTSAQTHMSDSCRFSISENKFWCVRAVLVALQRRYFWKIHSFAEELLTCPLLRLPFFCRAMVKDDKGISKEIRGDVALLHLWREAFETKKQGDVQLDFKKLSVFHMFGWRLSEDKRSMVQEATKKILHGGKGDANTSTSAASKTATHNPKKKKSDSDAVDTANVAALFR